MKKTEDNLIDRTIEVWQPRNDQRLSDEDARAILENVKGFFTLLLEWETNEQQKKGGGQDESYREVGMTIRFSDRLHED